jgi:YD repeat-containing protein
MTIMACWVMALAALAARAQTVSHDTLGRVTRVSYGGSTNVAYGYDAAGNITNIAYSGTLSEPDSDGDGMPDMWEWVWFNTLTNTATGDPNQNGKNNLWEFQNGYDPLDPDSDDDGALNWDEMAAGTDPLDPLSVFQVSGFNPQVSGPVVQWSSVATKRYRLQRSSHLPDGFGNLLTNVLATPPMNVHTDQTAVGVGPWIYRVELE